MAANIGSAGVAWQLHRATKETGQPIEPLYAAYFISPEQEQGLRQRRTLPLTEFRWTCRTVWTYSSCLPWNSRVFAYYSVRPSTLDR